MSNPLPLTYEYLQKLATADLVRPDNLLGAHLVEEGGVPGVRFAAWAPNARAVGVVGDFNGWEEGATPLARLDFGFWGGFVPHAAHGQTYKFSVTGQDGRTVQKADPYARHAELRPKTASVIWQPEKGHPWSQADADWLAARQLDYSRPVSVYELHLGSWLRDENGWFLNYRELAPRVADYVTGLGYTHVELMGVMEHPFDGSWGYQATGYYAPNSRHGTPEDFKFFVDTLHARGLGVIVDWVPSHFATDQVGLAQWDGGPLFEYADPRKGYHFDWDTYIFDYGRNEVVMFLVGSALRWLEDFHVDGLRVDAVASMLYLDFSRTEWIPNVFGGRENLEAIAFLKRLNEVVHHHCPGAMMVAEESTSFPGVTWPTPNGLGFDYKWAMGWMNDTLAYFQRDPLYRKYEHGKLTFFNVYRDSEHFMLAISHDEVVHGKGSLVNKMPGDWYAQRAGLRAFLGLQWTMPGKKLLFMGQELAQRTEWRDGESLPWSLLDDPEHRGVHDLVRDLNNVYRHFPALHASDHDPEGLVWLQADDAENSVYGFLRQHPASGQFLVVIANLTPVYREGYALDVPLGGRYRPVIDTDSPQYGGFGTVQGDLMAQEGGVHTQPFHLRLNLAPNSVLVLAPAE